MVWHSVSLNHSTNIQMLTPAYNEQTSYSNNNCLTNHGVFWMTLTMDVRTVSQSSQLTETEIKTLTRFTKWLWYQGMYWWFKWWFLSSEVSSEDYNYCWHDFLRTKLLFSFKGELLNHLRSFCLVLFNQIVIFYIVIKLITWKLVI